MSRRIDPHSAPRRGLALVPAGLAALWIGALLAGSAAATTAPPEERQDVEAHAVQESRTQDPRVGALRSALEGALSGRWDRGRWSVLAVSIDTGDTLFARDPGTALAPASNIKLLTTAAALFHLGPDYRYRTLVLADGPVEDGVLRGDLILYGTGDPGLSDRFYERRIIPFENLVRQLREAGIRSVEGDLVGDGSYFQGPLLAEGWEPEDLNDWFAAPAAALSFNENVVSLRVEASRSGGAPTVHTLPPNADIPIRNVARTGSGPRLLIKREHPTDPVTVEGAIPGGGRDVWRQVTVGDPVRFATRIFRNVLEEEGVTVRGSIRTVSDPSRSVVTGRRLWAPTRQETRPPRILASHESPPLSDYLEVVNKRSHNLLAELTLKTLGRVMAGDGSYQGGAAVVEGFLASRAGVDTSRVTVVDGSGLSARNQMSAGAFVQLMEGMSESESWDAFWATLPEAGNPRELRRMYQTPAAGNLRAKTGTIDRVSALSGMVHSTSGERIAFSIIGNDLPSTWGAKSVEDRIGVELASLQRPFERRGTTRLAEAPRGGGDTVGRTVAGRSDDRTAAAEGDTGEASEVASAVTTGETAATGSPDGDGPAEAAGPTRYRVQRGENFTVIARRHGLSLSRLLEANPEIEPSRLQAGQMITIPAPEEGTGEG